MEVVSDERFPVLRRSSAPFEHVASHGRFTDPIAQLHEFAVDAWRSPRGVLKRNPFDQCDDLIGNAGSTDFLGPTLPSPPQAPSFAVPGDDGFGFDQRQGAAPVPPFSVENNPEGLFQQGKRWFRIGSPKDQDLLPEGEVFQQQVAVGTQEVPQQVPD